MATAQAMEEELQQSVLASDTTDWAQDASGANATSYSANRDIATGNTRKTRSSRELEVQELDEDASGEEVEEDAEGEDDVDLLQIQEEPANPYQDVEEEEEDAEGEEVLIEGEEDAEGEDEDAEGEDEEVQVEDEDAEGEEDDEVEGVGAVKVMPPDFEDEDDAEEDESDVSDLASGVDEAVDEDSDADEEVAWEDARDEADGDEDSEVAASNVCIFCKQDEENDPSEDFEAFLACRGCGENAHQQCARDEDAMDEHNGAKSWRCPTCFAEASEGGEDDEQQSVATDGRPGSQRSDVPKLARALLAAETGSVDGDSHSVFNELVLEDAPKDGSRHLRKRKTSSIEPEDSLTALRKRRRNASAEDNDDTTDGANSTEATGGRSARTLRLKVPKPPPATVEKHTRTSLVIKLHVKPGNLKEVMSRKKRDRKRTGGSSRPSRPAAPVTTRASHTPVPMIETPFTAESYSQPFYSFFDRDTDDAKGKPYGGILTDNEADTSKTLPQSDDRQRFDQAKRKADDEWRARVLAIQAEAEAPVRRPKKNDHASQIECIEFGGWEIDTWYAAPYPAEYSRNRVLYICEYCLKYMNSDYVAWRHKLKCAAKHPPGDEIYRHGSISFFEVDGRKNPVYCQNLCLLAKLFLGSKTLYYDVEPFLFYVLCEYDETGYHFVGYFSKEKRSSSQNNVSCILTLPIHQRKGYGNLLIDFSYLLTKVEEKTGSPEKPLSDLGLVSYRSYWRLVLCRYLLETMEKADHKTNGLSIKQISDDTAMTPDDVIAALEGLRALVRDPQTKVYAFRADLEFCRQYVSNWESKGHVKLKPEALAWTPYVMGRGIAAQLELGPISTVAPRAEDEARVDEGPNGIGANTQPKINGIKEAMTAQKGVAASQDADSQLKAEAKPEIAKGTEGDKENDAPQDAEPMDVDGEDEEWDIPYKNIPPSRFEIFPPAPNRGRKERAQPSFTRPLLSQTASSAPRPRPKRPSGSSSRPKSSRPKASSARRKSGGTGRGPGRWPKGTKKADYGNADSGPGFPPGWTPAKDTPTKGEGAASKLDEEDVQVVVSDVPMNGNGEEGREHGPAEDGEDVDAEGEDA